MNEKFRGHFQTLKHFRTNVNKLIMLLSMLHGDARVGEYSRLGTSRGRGSAVRVLVVEVEVLQLPRPAGDRKPENQPPLWDYVTKLEKKGEPEDWSYRCHFSGEIRFGSYSRVKARLLQIKNQGVDVCKKVIREDKLEMARLDEEWEKRIRIRDQEMFHCLYVSYI